MWWFPTHSQKYEIYCSSRSGSNHGDYICYSQFYELIPKPKYGVDWGNSNKLKQVKQVKLWIGIYEKAKFQG